MARRKKLENTSLEEQLEYVEQEIGLMSRKSTN